MTAEQRHPSRSSDESVSGQLSSDPLTFASAGVAGVHYARCWGCMLGQHMPAATWHTWADSEDIDHALATGQPDPSTGRCGCWCASPTPSKEVR